MLNFILAAAAATTVTYSDYPGALSRRSPVEAMVDKGLIVELVVRCGDRAGILTYSKVDRRFCDASLRCHARLGEARAATCNGH